MFCRSGLRAAIGAAAIAARRPLLRKAELHAADGLFFCTRTAPAIRNEPRPAPSPLEPAQCRPSRPADAGIRHQTPIRCGSQPDGLPPVIALLATFQALVKSGSPASAQRGAKRF